MLWEAFRSIVGSSGDVEAGGEAFGAIQFPECEGHLLGKSLDGRAVVLVRVKDERRVRGVRLRNIAVQGTQRFTATAKAMRSEGNCLVVRCLSSEQPLQEYFLEVIGRMLFSLPKGATAEQASARIEQLVELFLLLDQPGRGSLQGLWAELFVIANARKPRTLLEAWHDDAEDRYDFEGSGQVLEVKSAGGGERSHHFSLEQLEAGEWGGLLVSLFVERQGSGLSLRELWNQVMEVAQGEEALERKVERICLDVLGSDWLEFCDVGFDQRLARRSMKYFRFEEVPKIQSETIAPEIRDVRFRVSLEGTRDVLRKELELEGGLFEAV